MSLRPALAFATLVFACTLARADSQTGRFGDQGDGTYRNPIIAADYSDPDPIRVGNDYYMVSSTFQYSPGVSVLHSKDLVNWRSLGGVFIDISVLGPRYNWDRLDIYKNGVYAPSIRHHDGKFWVFVNCYQEGGFWVATAVNPAGPWTVTQIKDKNGKPLRTTKWTDPSPFWDEDGKAYLATSRPSSRWFGYLFQMTPDGTRLLDADVDAMNKNDGPYPPTEGGTIISPFQSTEGNKIYKRNGLYYLVHIEFGDGGQGNGTYVFRSKNIYGTKPDGTPGKPGDPGTYDVLKMSNDLPGQGGLVDTPDGRWFWIAQFNRMEVSGRSPHLVPVTWIDEWPVVGVNINTKDRKGRFSWQLPKPIPGAPITLPQGSDDFNRPTLDPQWAWNHQPRAGFWSLTDRPGYLRLRAFKPLKPDQFFKVGNVLLQRHVQSTSTVATVKFDLAGLVDGQEAGLAHCNGGKNYSTIAVVQQHGARALKYEEDGKPMPGPAIPQTAASLWLRSTVGMDALVAYSFSLDGKTFIPFGGAYKARPAGYRGDQVGIYTVNATGETGHVDIDWFHYEIPNH